ncbi:MAG: sulfotransferase family protein [Bacteroidia bacterium]
MVKNNNIKFVFIGGCGRSGTTLVQKLLLLNSRITGYDEFDFLPQLLLIYGKMNSPVYLNRQSAFYNQEQLKEYWRKFIYDLLLNNIEAGNFEYFSEKTPDNIDCAEQILELIPESKFIYVYRDGRDVINSYKQVKKRARENDSQMLYSMKDWALMWNKASREYLQLKNNNRFENRHIAVKYEDLTGNPEKKLGEIMAFLNLPVEPRQLTPELADAGSLKMNVEGTWYTDEMFKQKINVNSISKWKKELNPIEKFIYQTIMGPRLKENDYPVSPVYIKLHSLLKYIYLRFNKN